MPQRVMLSCAAAMMAGGRRVRRRAGRRAARRAGDRASIRTDNRSDRHIFV
uniref:Uncharacterized protein n=1 Tax=Lysobacter sp. ATCC 53042 TaxID=324869 RepID=F8TUH4_9GAMM|nr:unknown [Lysobacter sp. ATCC 53042]